MVGNTEVGSRVAILNFLTDGLPVTRKQSRDVADRGEVTWTSIRLCGARLSLKVSGLDLIERHIVRIEYRECDSAPQSD